MTDTRIPLDVCDRTHLDKTLDEHVLRACRDPRCHVTLSLVREWMTDPTGDPDRVEPIVRAYLQLHEERIRRTEGELIDLALGRLASGYDDAVVATIDELRARLRKVAGR